MFKRILGWFGAGRDTAKRRGVEETHMSPSERRFVEESVEDHQADEFVQGQLGGEDPKRLLGD